jgi:2-oxoacid:acceptor oxidoreductase delta subunit (pyruvate/2-ketoisovalerate family)
MKNKINLKVSANSAEKNQTGGWRTSLPETDFDKCTGCGTCARLCPEGAIKMELKNGKQKPRVDLNYCKGCGLCAEECPVKAIIMKLEKK